MWHWLKRKNKQEEYPLRLEDILCSGSSMICIFSEVGGITPLKIEIDKVFSSLTLLKSIHPETLLALRKAYELNDRLKNKVKLSATLNNNGYEIIYDSKFKVTTSGTSLCQDLELLSLMPVKDVFTIVYNTAFNAAISQYTHFDQTTLRPTATTVIDDQDPKAKIKLVKSFE